MKRPDIHHLKRHPRHGRKIITSIDDVFKRLFDFHLFFIWGFGNTEQALKFFQIEPFYGNEEKAKAVMRIRRRGRKGL